MEFVFLCSGTLFRAVEQGLKMWKMYQHFPPFPTKHVHFTPTTMTGTISLSQTLPAQPQVFHISPSHALSATFHLKPCLCPGPEAFHHVESQAFLSVHTQGFQFFWCRHMMLLFHCLILYRYFAAFTSLRRSHILHNLINQSSAALLNSCIF